MIMKRLFPALLLSLLVLISCDDDKNVALNNAVLEFIESRYPGANVRSSEYEDDGLVEVEIMHDRKIKEVHFDSQDNWIYTSWDVRPADLPTAVAAVLGKAYPGYSVDDADYIERPALEYYKVELEKGEYDVEAYVSPEGVILESVEGSTVVKPTPSDAVRAFIGEKYPDARIIGCGYALNGLLEVEIMDGTVEKDVYFDSNENWVRTDWDVPVSALPDAVLEALAGSYPHYFIDSAESVERPGGVIYYEIELERESGTEIVVNVTPEGKVLK